MRAAGLGMALLLMSAPSLGSPQARVDRSPEARRHFLAGTLLYSEGKFDAALREFSAANQLKPDAALLFDLAQTHRALGHETEALTFYRAYVEAAPYAPNRDEVLGKIKIVEEEQARHERERAQLASQAAVAAARIREAEEARQATIALQLQARNLMAEAEAAKVAARDAELRAQRAAGEKPTPLVKRWWLWTAVGVVAVAGVATAVALTRPTLPSTTQGNFDF